MKDLIKKSESFNKIEFWGITTLFVFILFFFITDGIEGVTAVRAANSWRFDEVGVPFNFYENYFIPRLIRYVFFYGAFLLLNFVVVPKLIKKEAVTRNVFLILMMFLLGGLLLGITDTYLKNYLFVEFTTEQAAYNSIFFKSYLYALWLLLMLGFYTMIKYGGVYLLSNAEALQARYRFITPGGLIAIVIWMIGLFILLLVHGEVEEITIAWGIIVPFGIALYWYAFSSLIPGVLPKKRAFLLYMAKVILLLVVTYLPVCFLILLLKGNEDIAFSMGFLNMFFQALITAPLSWVLYKRHMRGNEEIFVLKKELGQSNASFDFLRSQINPHFLFNALNTIYGTAIQEKAERTSEGIERLGDMMRFMLQENMQDNISLAREIEYLNNYISLQRLRTDPNPNINIQAEIEQPLLAVQIAPMLLIPFVENAFKHGISFREPSHIKVGLEVKNSAVYFDVYNSKHVKPESDPEKNKSGIGLTNVKQRLQLLYPGRHELIIRETGKEFFVHLTIALS